MFAFSMSRKRVCSGGAPCGSEYALPTTRMGCCCFTLWRAASRLRAKICRLYFRCIMASGNKEPCGWLGWAGPHETDKTVYSALRRLRMSMVRRQFVPHSRICNLNGCIFSWTSAQTRRIVREHELGLLALAMPAILLCVSSRRPQIMAPLITRAMFVRPGCVSSWESRNSRTFWPSRRHELRQEACGEILTAVVSAVATTVHRLMRTKRRLARSRRMRIRQGRSRLLGYEITAG